MVIGDWLILVTFLCPQHDSTERLRSPTTPIKRPGMILGIFRLSRLVGRYFRHRVLSRLYFGMFFCCCFYVYILSLFCYLSIFDFFYFIIFYCQLCLVIVLFLDFYIYIYFSFLLFVYLFIFLLFIIFGYRCFICYRLFYLNLFS